MKTTAEPSFSFRPSECEWVVVQSVADGDTLRFGREKVRLIGIDTPETEGPYTDAEPHGDTATAFARELMPRGAEVCLVAGNTDRDKYDRLLRYVFTRDGVDVSAALLDHGLARAYTFAHPLRRDYAAREKAAKRLAIGIWQSR